MLVSLAVLHLHIRTESRFLHHYIIAPSGVQTHKTSVSFMLHCPVVGLYNAYIFKKYSIPLPSIYIYFFSKNEGNKNKQTNLNVSTLHKGSWLANVPKIQSCEQILHI